ncbi:MAG: acyl-CoA dehydrogenase [Smithellaceae bacterium]|nr:acyl-CoA dehydrogenase [Smithellaceae bacterium]
MARLIIDERDQKFLLNDMFQVEKLCSYPRYADFSPDMFDMIINEAEKFSVEEVFPTYTLSDKHGAELKDGQVIAPEPFKRLYKLYCEGGWLGMNKSVDVGGQGLPSLVTAAAKDWFLHNFSFVAYPGLSEGASHLIEVYGTEAQKKKYMERMNTGEWAGTMCLTEPSAGTDVGALKTKAYRQPDGTFKIQGTKLFITSGDHDLTKNIIHPVLARIEGDPNGTGGISIFIVPKYLVNDDGSLGRRNDYSIGSIEEKMGLHGSSTCLINFGDNNDCYGELLGEEREGIKVMFQMMNEARIGVGLQGLAGGSIAYLHALQYAKDRLQGSDLIEMKNPDAARVPIIKHADVRRMLIWMKSQVEGMRALMYFSTYCVDRMHCAEEAKDEAEIEKFRGILEVLTPICKSYCSDIGFKVTEQAIQVYGGYGYCAEYPAEQFMRDMKIASLYEGTNGIQALDLVGRKLGMKKGAYFMTLLGEMNATVAKYKGLDGLADIAADVQAAGNTLAETSMFFASSAKAGKFMIPVSNAYPFMMMMGRIVIAWLLLWEAGVATAKLAGIDKDSADGIYLKGKVSTARYFIKHVLPEIDGVVRAIKSEDLSMLDIAEEAF